MAHEFDQFQKQRDIVLQDAAAKLPSGDRDALLIQAILQRYSKDRAQQLVSDAAGNGTPYLDLPESSQGSFEEGFSAVLSLEYPVGSVPPNILLDEEWQMYRDPSALRILMTSQSPSVGENVRVTWTARHKDDGSTVPDYDFEAVCDFAAALCLEALAKTYAQTGDPTIMADSVNYRTKSQEYLSLSKAVQKRYFDHLGVSQNPDTPQVGPALANGSVHETLSPGLDRLTHPSASR